MSSIKATLREDSERKKSLFDMVREYLAWVRDDKYMILNHLDEEKSTRQVGVFLAPASNFLFLFLFVVILCFRLLLKAEVSAVNWLWFLLCV